MVCTDDWRTTYGTDEHVAVPKVIFRTCPLYVDTVAAKVRGNAVLKNKLDEFIKSKEEDPMKPYGGSDTAYNSDGNFTKAVPGIKHAHLQHDAILAYTLSGRNPHVIDLYGIFTHDESGTGRPPNDKRQKNLSKKFRNQSFD